MESEQAFAKAVRYKTMLITSPAFEPGMPIPPRYTCDGENVNPPLEIEKCPTEASSLAVIVDDPDAPMGNWSHWLVWNIPVTHLIRSNHPHGEEGRNDFSRNQYDGPCPQKGKHRYHFKVYALDTQLSLAGITRQKDLEKAMAGHILAFGEVVGTYQKHP